MSVADSSEDVNDFLQRIKELGHKRDEEDDERARKLEQEILEGRKQRQARRSERARSISPTKSSPANTPTASKGSLGLPSASSSQDLSTSHDPQSRPDTTIENTMDQAAPTSSPTKQSYAAESDARTSESNYKLNDPPKISPSSAMPSRSSPLSWQRRPTSQSSDQTRSRPLSMVATENAARSPKIQSPEASPATAEPVLSRDQISQSLATKDASWFRQTADRGVNSPAYRRNQVEDDDRSDHKQSSAPIKLPGMSRENSASPRTAEEHMDRSSSPSSSAAIGNTMRSSYHASPATAGRVGSPQVPLTGPLRLDPPNSGSQNENRGLAMSPSQGRISPERLDRPVSPTKGMGGFVQSAMMKRSDSVNKRWSVQSPAGLNRANSVASNRSNQDAGTGNTLGAASHTSAVSSSISRENSPRPPSRPTSSHSTATASQDRPAATSIDNDGFVKPALPSSRSQTPQATKEGPNEPSLAIDTTSRIDATPPISPSKTMDPRRWSPTKSSWLETALSKPESPKPKSVPPQQPSWMSEINKAKQKGSVDLSRGPVTSIKHEVAIGGLMRSPPPGGLSKPPSTGGLPSGFSPAGLSKSRAQSISSQGPKDTPRQSDLGETSSNASRSPPITTKVKPETPPKKDFRSTLKPRQIPTESSGATEPEFKNVFGQLRRTKTQNYVAPDELKNNITRGKAALNITGGPKKTERTDEFKEAILKKKEDFKKAQLEGKGIRPTSGTNKDNDVPEALARRRAMSKVEPSSSIDVSSTDQTEPSKSFGIPKESVTASSRIQGKETVGGKLAGRFNPALAGLLARGPPSMASDASRSSSPAHSTTSQRAVSTSTNTTTEPQEPGPQLTHMTKSRARGPRRKAPSTAPSTPSADPDKSEPESTSVSDTAKLEKVNSAPQPVKPLKLVQSISQPDSVSPTKDVTTSQPSSPRKLDMKRRSQFLQEGQDKINKIEAQLETPRPLSPTKKANTTEIPTTVEPQTPAPPTFKSPNASGFSPVAPTKPRALATSSSQNEPRSPPSQDRSAKPPVTPQSFRPIEPIITSKAGGSTDAGTNSPSHTNNTDTSKSTAPQPLKAVKSVTALWNRSVEPTQPQASPRARSPIKLPTQSDENAAMVSAGLRSPSPSKLDTKTAPSSHSRGQVVARPLPVPPKAALSPTKTSESRSSPMSPKFGDSLVPQASEASSLVAEFFGDRRAPVQNYMVDTAAMLAARPEQDFHLKTLRSSMCQLGADGKKQPVPSHQERILFEGNMYLCTHTFVDETGRKVTEVYYWQGYEVPRHVVADAEIFAHREAKNSGGKLVIITQGRETPGFFAALGGVIVIRRGTSNKFDSLAPNILCGRKHIGQVAFDEVDFSQHSLCSGFPYLISTPSGKTYLWKGKGSGIEELSCARLIGMEFGLTGEIEEVEDGNETASFLDVFGGAEIPKSADHWRMKPNYSKYCSRLFCADSALKEQIIEINPFSQSDISPSKIYILDAFFEIYVIVGARTQSQYPAFHHALTFGQEYGILAASMEDRPFVPVSTVVIEGIPRDMKSVFRTWREELTPTLIQRAGAGVRRGRSLRCVPLNAAIEATR